MGFPSLPHCPDAEGWPADISSAYTIINIAFLRAMEITALQGPDPYQINMRLDSILTDALPLLEALSEDESFPDTWVREAADLLYHAVAELEKCRERIQGLESTKVTYMNPVTIVRTGKRGRPRKVINEDFLREVMSTRRNISIVKAAEVAEVNRHTIMRANKALGLKKEFSKMSQSELDRIMKDFKKMCPKQGIQFARSHLMNLGYRVQKHKVIASLRRVDRLGSLIRNKKAIKRRQYKVKRPNHLWHCDGHHKLIRWGIVIHGFIDGFCRTVTGLRASNNNRASTVKEVFKDAMKEFGIPRRIRGDRGGENVEVAVVMVVLRGKNTAAFIWGSSTHNTRIERLWVDIGIFFVRQWRVFFMRLERMHYLDATNPEHLWLIHYLFLPTINQDCRRFQLEWNLHAVSGPTTNDQTPNDMRFLGKWKHGVNDDPCDGMSIEEIEEHYGCFGKKKERRTHQTGAGHNGDDAGADSDLTIEDGVGQLPHVKVKSTTCPFGNNITSKVFKLAFTKATEEDYVPEGYGVREEEWDDDEYPAFELLQVGKKRSGETVIPLPTEIWLPRARMWARALAIQAQIMDD